MPDACPSPAARGEYRSHRRGASLRPCNTTVLVLAYALLLTVPAVAGPLDQGKAEELIRQLGSARFSEREDAAKELGRLGELALGTLRKAATSDKDPEVRRRAGLLAQEIEGRPLRAFIDRTLSRGWQWPNPEPSLDACISGRPRSAGPAPPLLGPHLGPPVHVPCGGQGQAKEGHQGGPLPAVVACLQQVRHDSLWLIGFPSLPALAVVCIWATGGSDCLTGRRVNLSAQHSARCSPWPDG